MPELDPNITCPNDSTTVCPRLLRLKVNYLPEITIGNLDPDGKDPYELNHDEPQPPTLGEKAVYGALVAEHSLVALATKCGSETCGVEEKIRASRIRRSLLDRAKALVSFS